MPSTDTPLVSYSIGHSKNDPDGRHFPMVLKQISSEFFFFFSFCNRVWKKKKQAREIQYVNITGLHNTVKSQWVTSVVFVNIFKDAVMLIPRTSDGSKNDSHSMVRWLRGNDRTLNS